MAKRQGNRQDLEVAANATLTCARLAAQLAREVRDGGSCAQADAKVAYDIIVSAGAARHALMLGRSPSLYYKTMRSLLRMYGATLVTRGQLSGMVVGIRFASQTYVEGLDDVMHIA